MKAPMLGIMDGFKFTQNSIQLSSGDLLFMYTDGVTEAMDKGRQLFSLARLEQVLTALSGDVPPATVIDTVAKAVINHRQDADQSDDITVLAMHYF
jgi:sigma-B regulation protein RsbU (phosphoserine phosphatase)